MNIFSPFSNLTHKNSIFCVNFIFRFNPQCSKRMNFKQPESTAAFETEIPEKRKRKCKPKIDSFQKVCFRGCVAGRMVELCARHPGNPLTQRSWESRAESGGHGPCLLWQPRHRAACFDSSHRRFAVTPAATGSSWFVGQDAKLLTAECFVRGEGG